ncbi:MAG: hypothetical protein ACRYG8_35855 [Janthinobacterium lividum]
MTWTSYRDEEQPSWCTGVWQPLPEGYDPVLPTMGSGVSLMPIPGYAVPLLGTPVFGKVSFGTPARDPTVGVFIRDQNLPANLLEGGTHFQNPHLPYSAHGFAIGRDAIGDPDARIGGPRVPPMHPALPTAAKAAIASHDGLVIEEVTLP